MASLIAYSYRDNVRELENIIEQTVVMAMGEVVHRGDLPANVTQAKNEMAQAALTYENVDGGFGISWLNGKTLKS